MTDKNQPTPVSRLPLYCTIILISAFLGFAYGARTTGLFACQAPMQDSDQYMGLCNVTNYGDYDHGAFWFELEPTAVEAATEAAILFIGNSRMQFGLSTDEVDTWFKSRALTYYLLGFSHHENHLFYNPLLQKLKPAARILVLNVDNFFENKITGPANSVMNEADSVNRYKQKFYWQKIHERACGLAGFLCGNGLSFIRDRGNGAWIFQGADFLSQTDFSDQPVTYNRSVESDTLRSYETSARSFLANPAIAHDCVILINIPNSDTTAGTAKALAARLDLPLVAPEMDNLATFDGSHLDPESAERWSRVFVKALAPHIEHCLEVANQ